MAKEKKINVKLFPRQSKTDPKLFTFYIRVSYNRKSTMISTGKSFKGKLKNGQLDLTKKDKFEKFFNSLSKVNGKEHLIEKVIREEIRIFGDNYSIVGFGERWPIYDMYIDDFIGKKLNKILLKNLEDVLYYSQYNDFLNWVEFSNPSIGFLEFFKSLDFLEQSFKLDVKKTLTHEIYELILISGYYHLFLQKKVEGNNHWNDIKEQFLSRTDFEKYKILDWAGNQAIDFSVPDDFNNKLKSIGLKDEFINFTSIDRLNQINDDTNGKFHVLFSKVEFSLKENLIPLRVDKLIFESLKEG